MNSPQVDAAADHRRPARFRRRYIWIALVLVVGVGAFLMFVPKRVVREKAGWRLAFSHSRLFCAVCTAHDIELTYNGAPVPHARIRSGQDNYNAVTIYTPVGSIMYDDRGSARPFHWSDSGHRFTDSDTMITPAELTAGHYELAPSTRPSGQIQRKQNTPASWCVGHTNGVIRWVEPGKLGDFDW